MKLARTGILAAAMLSVATMAFAQSKTDFSGTWTPDQSAATAAPAGGGGGGQGGGGGRGGGMMGPMTVKQTADSLTIERSAGENKITSTYKLDGTESENKMMGRGGEVGRRQADDHHEAGGPGWHRARVHADVVARRGQPGHREHASGARRKPHDVQDDLQENDLRQLPASSSQLPATSSGTAANRRAGRTCARPFFTAA